MNAARAVSGGRPRVVQATWVRYHHFDLARELHALGALDRIFTCLPAWKVAKESREQGIPRSKISSNPFTHALRFVYRKLPVQSAAVDWGLGILQTREYSRWVARNLPECDAFIGLSGTGLHAGRLARRRGSLYIMDRGSTQIRHANRVLGEEHARWAVPWRQMPEWVVTNEEEEAATADLITVPSDFVKQTFVQEGTPADKVRVVPYGVSLDEFHPVAAPPPDAFHLLFVGQFSLRKGAPYLLEAFRDFRHPHKRLTVVGGVPDEIVPLIRRIGSEHVTFTGAVPRSEVKRYMSSAHALVLPSIEEGLALVQAQALACGCPVIATPNTGSESLFTHGREGLIVPARSASSLVEAFEQLAADPALRERMSVAALARVREFGGWRSYGESMLRVIEAARAG